MCIENPVPMKARWTVAYKVVDVVDGVYRSEFTNTRVKDGKPGPPVQSPFRKDPNLVGKWSAFRKLKDARWWTSLAAGQVILKVALKGDLIKGDLMNEMMAPVGIVHVAGESIKILGEVI